MCVSGIIYKLGNSIKVFSFYTIYLLYTMHYLYYYLVILIWMML